MQKRVEELMTQKWNIQVVGRHVQVTDAMKNYAIDKISKIERFANQIVAVEVLMDIQKIEQSVLIKLKIGHTRINVSASTIDMYASIDLAVEKLRRKIWKYRSKLKEHHGEHLGIAEVNVSIMRRPGEEVIERINDAIEEENLQRLEETYAPHEIVATEMIPLKQLTYEEAAIKMDLSEDAFMLFRNEADLKLKVIYRRKDGNYGVIEPE